MFYLRKFDQKSMKLIPEAEIPEKAMTRSDKWLEFFLKIPEGQAIATTEAELGVRSSSVRDVLASLQKRGKLGKNYRVIERRKGKELSIYIVNSAKK